jgi:hypothetical protein
MHVIPGIYPRRNIFVTNITELSSTVDRIRTGNFSGALRTKLGINKLLKSRIGRKKEKHTNKEIQK